MVTYSEEAFTSDDWTGLEWGRDFDFSRPFFDQYFELWRTTPKQIANAYFSENCEFIINAHRNKDCYLADEIDRCRDCYYGYNIQDCIGTVNCFYARKSELCYSSSQIEHCYEMFFSDNLVNCSNSAFLAHCTQCHNCLFCVNLRSAEYRIFNEKVSKEEFESRWKELFCGKREIMEEAHRRFEEFRLRFAVRSSVQMNTENCTGNQISHSKNCFDCFNVDNSQDCRYCTDIHYSRDAYDVHIYEGEIMYECLHAGPKGYAQFFSHFPWFSKNVFYCSQLLSCNNVFGCSGLKNQEYCILNKKYAPDEYERMVGRIIEHMQATREWGEFFPVSFSPYGYNQTMAAYYNPLSQEEVNARGFVWKDTVDPHGSPEAIVVPGDLSQTDDLITKKTLISTQSDRRFRVMLPEMQFLRKYNLPLPETTPAERLEWFVRRNPRTLYDRECAKCERAIRTIYSPERPEQVLCEECYLKEVY
jgi:hypothetical protein